MRKSTIFGLAIVLGMGAVNVMSAQSTDTKAPSVNYTLTPQTGSNLTEIGTVTLTFEEGVNVGFYDVHPAVAVLDNLDNGDLYYSNPQFMGRSESGEMVYTFEFSELGDEESTSVNIPANYSLTIRGAYTSTIDDEGEESDPVDLPVINATYSVVFPIDYTLNPASGAQVEEIEAITITFAPGANVGIEDGRETAVMLENLEDGTIYTALPSFAGRDEEGAMSYTLEFTETGEEESMVINIPGTYQLTIRGIYTTTIDDDGEESEKEYLPVINATYTVIYPIEYEINPASGSSLSEISKITLTFEAGVNVGFYEGRENTVILECVETEELYYSTPFSAGRNADGQMVYELEFTELGSDEYVTLSLPGTYRLSIQGIYTSVIDDNGEESDPTDLPPLNAVYTIAYPVTYYLYPDNGAYVAALSEVYITFEGGVNVGIEETYPGSVLENLDTEDSWFCSAPRLLGFEENGEKTFVLEFGPLGAEETETIVTPGAYMLTIKGVYTSTLEEDEDGEEGDMTESEPNLLPNIVVYYVVTGDDDSDDSGAVASIFNNETTFNVYGFNGVQYVRNGDASALRSLKPGMYIINGKKVVIR